MGFVYLGMMDNLVLTRLEEEIRRGNQVFQQDGARCDFKNFVRTALNEKFPCCLLGSDSPIS
jgi:hypothetical protein